jgi:hypothetical protein
MQLDRRGQERRSARRRSSAAVHVEGRRLSGEEAAVAERSIADLLRAARLEANAHRCWGLPERLRERAVIDEAASLNAVRAGGSPVDLVTGDECHPSRLRLCRAYRLHVEEIVRTEDTCSVWRPGVPDVPTVLDPRSASRESPANPYDGVPVKPACASRPVISTWWPTCCARSLPPCSVYVEPALVSPALLDPVARGFVLAFPADDALLVRADGDAIRPFASMNEPEPPVDDVPVGDCTHPMILTS